MGKKLSPYFSKSHLSLYGIAGSIATTVTINYMILAFVLLSGSWAWAAYTSHYFFGHIGALIFYGILTVMPSPKKEKKDFIYRGMRKITRKMKTGTGMNMYRSKKVFGVSSNIKKLAIGIIRQ